MTPLEAIRAKCLDCCCGSTHEVKLCPCKDCALWPFRFGRNPKRTGTGNRASFAKKHGSTGDLEIEQSGMGKDIPQIWNGSQTLEMAGKEEA